MLCERIIHEDESDALATKETACRSGQKGAHATREGTEETRL